MAKFVVGPTESLPPGSRKSVEVEGRPIAVFNVDGTLYALRDACPHQGALLSTGHVVGAVDSDVPGCYLYNAGRKLIKCPWHGWEFDLATGQSWFDPRKQRVKPYPVAVQSGEQLNDAQKGPYVAETVRVSVEHDYVVLEV